MYDKPEIHILSEWLLIILTQVKMDTQEWNPIKNAYFYMNSNAYPGKKSWSYGSVSRRHCYWSQVQLQLCSAATPESLNSYHFPKKFIWNHVEIRMFHWAPLLRIHFHLIHDYYQPFIHRIFVFKFQILMKINMIQLIRWALILMKKMMMMYLLIRWKTIQKQVKHRLLWRNIDAKIQNIQIHNRIRGSLCYCQYTHRSKSIKRYVCGVRLYSIRRFY